MYSRHVTKELQAALDDTPVVFLQGPRQTGKSTLVGELCRAEGRPYFTLDDAAVLGAARADPQGFVAGLPEVVALDEVQRVPELFQAIKLSVDERRQPGRFLLTGSTSVSVIPTLAESLVGRVELELLLPLSQGEIEGVHESFIDQCFSGWSSLGSSTASSWDALARRIVTGGYPEVVARGNSRRRSAWFGSYVTTILQRDVRDLANVSALAELPKLLQLAAARSAGILNMADLARDAALPRSTFLRYWSLLEATFLLSTLPAWTANLGTRLVKAPKVLLNDTGLCCHLLGFERLTERAVERYAGALLETFVVAELRKQATWAETAVRLFHFRTHAQREVDLVLEDAQGRVVGIEVKKSATVTASDFDGLRYLAAQVGERWQRGVLLYTGAQGVAFGKDLWALPVGHLWGG